MTSIRRSSHLRVVSAGRTPGFSAAILLASVSATDVFGNSVMAARYAVQGSDVEETGVTGLDGRALLFHRRRIVLQGLDVLERNPVGFFLGLWVHRAQSTDIDDELLGFAAETERLEQLCGVGIRRALEEAVRPHDHRRAFRRIDRLHRTARVPELQNVVL